MLAKAIITSSKSYFNLSFNPQHYDKIKNNNGDMIILKSKVWIFFK